MTYSPFGAGPITIDHENIVKVYSVSPSMLGRGHILMEPQGPIWVRTVVYTSQDACLIWLQSLHASDYHPQLAVGSADGVCSTTNTLRSTRRGGSVVRAVNFLLIILLNLRSQPFFVHKIYQLDYSRKTKEFRMLERFIPLVRSRFLAWLVVLMALQEAQDRPTQPRAIRIEKSKNKDTTHVAPTSSGAWPQEVGVQRVVWNCGNGMGASSLLASSTASSLCRVDVVWGRWLNDRVPYTSIPHLRMDVQSDAMDVDSDDST
jgi:transcription factor C subunit 6